jgi:hypothetical protein
VHLLGGDRLARVEPQQRSDPVQARLPGLGRQGVVREVAGGQRGEGVKQAGGPEPRELEQPGVSKLGRRVAFLIENRVHRSMIAASTACRSRYAWLMSDEEETPLAWTAIVAGVPVISSDREHLGTVTEVAGLPEDDIFHGVVFQHTVLGRHLLAPAADVERMTDRAVHLATTREQAADYEEFREMDVERLGVKGLFFWKHLGWKKSSE